MSTNTGRASQRRRQKRSGRNASRGKLSFNPAGVLNLGFELISLTANRKKVPGTGRIRFKLIPEARNVDVHRPRDRSRFVAPDLNKEPVTLQGLSIVLQEIPQKAEFHRRETDDISRPSHLPLDGITGDVRER